MRVVGNFHGVDAGFVKRKASWAAFAVALLLGVAACGGSSPSDASFGSGTSAPEPEGADTSANEAEDETSTSTEPLNDDAAEPEPADEPSEALVDDGFVAPVRFENGEHESSEPVDEALLEELLIEASFAAYDNWRTCITIGRDCDFERNVAPVLSGPHRVLFRQYLLGYAEGQRLEPGDKDKVGVVSVETFDLVPPIVAHVSLCVVDSGVGLIEAGPGREEQILNDDVAAYVLGYQLASDDDGVITVEGEWNVVPLTEDISLCDEYSR